MNTLSWLVYAAEVSERLSGVCGFLAVIVGIGGSLGCIAAVMAWADKHIGASGWLPALIIPTFVVIELALIGSAVALPSAKTIYMIAASEAGETVVTSPDAIEMMGDLKAIIKQRLKGELREIEGDGE